MVKIPNDIENIFTGNVGWILVLLLVAGSSFLIGSSYRQKQTASGVAVSSGSNRQNSSQTSPISDISATLQTTTQPVFDPTATVAAPTANNVTKPPSINPGVINLNSGTEVELESLPGIGPSKAKAIIDYRTANGPFVTIEEIEKVKGIGPKTFANLKSKITI